MGKRRTLVALSKRLDELGITPGGAAFREGRVLVDGRPVHNRASRVPSDASVVVRETKELRGTIKLRGALADLGVKVAGRVALDVGAAAGGFTTALLEAGAARVYAVDVGHGELLGSLRQDPRVVCLERTNVSELGPGNVPEPISLVTIDVSYLSLSGAVAALENVNFGPGAELVGLVKPMFELRLPSAPSDPDVLADAVAEARVGIEAGGWTVLESIDSPIRGARDAIEFFIHATRKPPQKPYSGS